MAWQQPSSTKYMQRREKPVKWRTALYIKQPFEDNYVPDCFLKELVTNADVAHPDLPSMILGTAIITQQISIVVIFLVVFMYASEGDVSVVVLFAADAGLLMSGYAVCSITDPTSPAFLSTVWWFFLFAMSLRVISPVLRTLTVSYSNDTIYALALILSAMHLIFHDYSYVDDSHQSKTAGGPPPLPPPSSPPPFHGTISLNASMFAAVLLASRLESNEMVFCFVLFAIEVFAFFPMARHYVRRRSSPLHLGITVLLYLTATGALLTRDTTLSVLYNLTVLFITIACPLWLLMIRRHKFNIAGPWDIARIDNLD